VVTSDQARFAIFAAPPADHPIAMFASAWLGRDARTGEAVPQPRIAELTPERLAEITASPRHYGFHGTLKAPFALAEGRTENELHSAAAEFAATRIGFSVPLTVGELAGFLALLPATPCPPLDRLAAHCVRAFDEFRAAPDAAELERRRAAGLSPTQAALLATWGYPYVMEEFRFHMTLTERLDQPERGRVMAILKARLAPLLGEPLVVDAISVFRQPDRASPFIEAARYPFSIRRPAA
jgi:putative phosphonate metabolism protein